MNAANRSQSFSAHENPSTNRTLEVKTPVCVGVPSRRGTEPSSVPASVRFSAPANGARTRVFVAAGNWLLREALCRMLIKRANIEIAGSQGEKPFQGKELLDGGVDVMLLISSGNLEDDLRIVRQARATAPHVRILVIGTTLGEGQFLQCVRAGISGFLWREASADEVVEAIRAVQSGEAVCPGTLSAALFRYFEQESSPVPCAAVQQRLGFTRREQQLIPFIAKGLTNKEIANHFCLSEQTVKNHLYRMKHKAGVDDRLSIVQRYRTQGFLL